MANLRVLPIEDGAKSGAWTVVGGATGYEVLSISADDTKYVALTSVGAMNSFAFRLGLPKGRGVYPDAHVLHFRMKKSRGTEIKVAVVLYDRAPGGASTGVARTTLLDGEWVDFDVDVLPAGRMDDYKNLWVVFSIDSVRGNSTLHVSELGFVVPFVTNWTFLTEGFPALDSGAVPVLFSDRSEGIAIYNSEWSDEGGQQIESTARSIVAWANPTLQFEPQVMIP